MKPRFPGKLLLCGLFWLFSGTLFAQFVDCSAQLSQALAAFDRQAYDEVPDLLSYCTDRKLRGFIDLNKSQRLQANGILVMSYLKLQDNTGARLAMTDLLESFPGYTFKKEDPPELRALYEQFDLDPITSLEISAGVTRPGFDLQTIYTFSGNPASMEPPHYTADPGISFGLNGHLRVWRKLYLYSGLQYRTNHFEYREEAREAVFLTSKEQQHLLSIPAGMRYYFELGKISIFPDVGLAGNLLLKADAFLGGNDLNADRELPGRDHDMRSLRKKTVWTGAFGAGISLPAAANSFGISVKYHTSFTPFTIGNGTSFELSRDYNFLENEVTYSYLSVNVFFMLHHYQPRKMSTR